MISCDYFSFEGGVNLYSNFTQNVCSGLIEVGSLVLQKILNVFLHIFTTCILLLFLHGKGADL
jgi:hypothetical protein